MASWLGLHDGDGCVSLLKQSLLNALLHFWCQGVVPVAVVATGLFIEGDWHAAALLLLDFHDDGQQLPLVLLLDGDKSIRIGSWVLDGVDDEDEDMVGGALLVACPLLIGLTFLGREGCRVYRMLMVYCPSTSILFSTLVFFY